MSATYASSTVSKQVFIVADRDFSVDGLASMLQAAAENCAVSCVAPGDDCTSALAASAPDVLLIQNEVITQPPERFIGGFLEQYPDVRILIFGKNMDDDHLYRLVRAGVRGYVNERMSGDQLKRALDCVLSGRTWIERHVMERFLASHQDFDAILASRFCDKVDQLCAGLTRRETEILYEVVRGFAIKQIAEEVHLSHQGVKMHLAKLFRKFKVNNRNQLILATFDQISPVDDISMLLRNGLQRKLQAANG